MSLKVKVDALIIGAGIMGASCAFQLSKRGLRVAVLEAQISPAMGSTVRSTAGVRVQFTEEVNIRLSWESIQEYQHFQDLYGEDAGYRPIGYLLLVPPERLVVHMASVRLQQYYFCLPEASKRKGGRDLPGNPSDESPPGRKFLAGGNF